MELILSLIVISIAHWFSDFVLQSEKVGKGKSSSLYLLSYHTIVYTISMFILCTPIIIINNFEFYLYFVFIIVNGLLHGIVDFITSKLRNIVYKKNNMYLFFVLVGLDQLIHSIILMCTLGYLTVNI